MSCSIKNVNNLCHQAQNSHAFRVYCFAALCFWGGLSISTPITAQTVIGGLTPDPSAMLDVQSNSKGVLFPRMTTAERNLITNAPTGLMIFNTTENRLQINMGIPGNVSWQNINHIGMITNLDCAGATIMGTLYSGQAASGVSVSVPYTGGNGGVHSGQTVTSTGITGLTATLSGGSFASGSGNLSYSITGTPSAAGTASFALTIGGQSCTLTLTVQTPITLSCNDAIRKGEMQPSITYNSPSGVTVIVPYIGGTGAAHSGQTVSSTTVTGFTATLSAGTFASGSGILIYEITGTSSTSGTANFSLNIGGSSCNLDLEVKACSALIDASTTKTFLCYNLGAYNTRASSSAPSWEINGDYWRWGILDSAAAGPTGSGPTEANDAAIANWNTLPVGGTGDWADPTSTKGPNDPCPHGFRVPSKIQWDNVGIYNPQSNVGGSSWSPGPTNYTTGKNIGSALFLPTPGYRDGSNGTLIVRGQRGDYWSSTEQGPSGAWVLYVDSIGIGTDSGRGRTFGFSVRCIAEN